MTRHLCTRLPWPAVALLLTGCGGASPSTPTPQSPAPIATPAPPPTPPPASQASFTISLPIRPGDSAHNAYGLVPFGVHIGDHGVDGHPGWDFEFAPGASVYAAASGTVQSVLPSGNGTGFGIQIEHRAGTRAYRTIYGVGTLAPGIAAGAAIEAGQALGVADVYTRTIGRTTVTYAMTHFQVDDFSSNAGLTNQHAVSADQWLDASARAALQTIWRDAVYTQEFVEPFLANPRDVSYPLTRRWSLRSGSLAATIDMTAASPQSTTFTYTFRDSSGSVVEQGAADVDALGKPLSTIDFIPSGSGQPRRGVYNIVDAELQIDYGAAGAPRPASLAGAAAYRTDR